MPNRVSRRVHRQRRLSVYTEDPTIPAKAPPCDILPDEILAYIFQHVVDDDFFNTRSPTALYATTALSWVCQRWKQITSSYSSLWSRLHLHLTPLSNPHNIYTIPNWLKSSGDQPLELVIDLRMDDVEFRIYLEGWNSYYPLLERRLDVDVTQNLALHIARLTRLDFHIDENTLDFVFFIPLWSVLYDAINLREVTITSVPDNYALFDDTRFLSHVDSLSLRYIGFYLGKGSSKISPRKLVLNHKGAIPNPQTFEQIMTWIDISLLTELHLYTRSLHVTSQLDDIKKPFPLPSLRILHFYDFEARWLTIFLPVISAPEVEDFLIRGREPFVHFVDFLTENGIYTFSKCARLHLDADCRRVGPDRLDALAAAFPNVAELHIRGSLSGVILKHLLSAEGADNDTFLWPKLTSITFARVEDNSNVFDQLFHLVKSRYNGTHPIRHVGYVFPNTQFAEEGMVRVLKKYVTVSRLEA